MTYASKIDTWLIGLVAAILLGNLGLLLFLWLSQPSSGMVFGVSTLILLGVIAVIIWLFATTHYKVTETELIIRSGPFYWNIPITTITQVKATRNPLSSPALSLDRLEISYGSQKKILVSPKEKADFLQALGQTVDQEREG